MRLVEPSIEWEQEHCTYIDEWGQNRLIPSSLNLEGYQSYSEFIAELDKRKKGDGKWLPFSSYFLVNDDNRILGMIDIRHELNDFLYRIGGNIGYSVRPTERKKGYATLALKLGLEKCRDLGMKEVLITCDQDNIGSAKVIINNGGVEAHSETDSDGTVKRRFWIYL
ncbi:GNAT family N-acetyltransferase [Ornithinibacillus halotolerans]|uniref:Acetyltransferase n=1 Tax=Ornithinibacillus halotolerans TaxID=1274357 RepID=A0A916RZL2_9BACI|nr:GNAT family N-acetyltransferase [Ornithinibacillus halotolerans]GGA77854.1 acetyltransferase [Ornithinibacillus halotolerans]